MTGGRYPVLIVLLFQFLLAACSKPPAFDGRRAFADLEKQCSFGPRVAGTDAHRLAGEYLLGSLKQTTDICRLQQFAVYDSVARTERRMFNIIASYYPKSDKRIMLCAHWDSRPYSDNDPDSTKRNIPINGANDGASGAALLLEVGRILKDKQPPVGVDIVLFDGEDYGTEGWPGGWFLGSKYFASTLQGYRPRAAILVDMIGYSDLSIYREAISDRFAGDLNDYIWKIASETGASSFMNSVKDTVSDDHIPLLSAGIKAIDIIDLDYPYWHTQEDTPDKCSPESLAEVGRVIVAAIFDKRITDF